MAGRGPAPKPAGLRQRRNKTAPGAKLPDKKTAAKQKVPALPKRDSEAEKWHPKVIEWWAALWTSPMAAEFLGPDTLGGLYSLAELYQQRWTARDTRVLVSVMTEIRLQEARFGLSPIDRRRLQWEVEKGEQAEEKTKRRRKARKLKKASKKDPRELLKVVE